MDLTKKMSPRVKRDVLLKNFTTFKIGGPAKYFLTVRDKEELIFALKLAKDLKLPFFILGKGSNLLVSDKGFDGLIIKNEINDILIKKNKVLVGAGVDLTKLAFFLAKKGLIGLEWAVGIPGTIGGAIYGNAQAFSGIISELIEKVWAIDYKTFEIKELSRKQCNFSLKNSIFKENKNLLIISALLRLKRGNPQNIEKKIKEYLNYRKTKQPLNFPSAGSVFINPEKKIKNRELFKKFPELVEYNKKGIIPAGYLIEKSGLAGKRIGGAKISEKHCNFIINLGGAKAEDVIRLIELAQKKVYKIFKIKLEPEIQFLGFTKNK